MGKMAANHLLFGYSWILVSCSWFALAKGQPTDPSEVSALKVIRSYLDDPRGNLKSWNKGDPCTSNWAGVLCFDMQAQDGYLHVRQLQLLNMNLSGQLAPELGLLSHAEILDFMWNNISGGIPKEIGNIAPLQLLLLNGNQLSGPLPEELGNLLNLKRLQIDENNISGPLPKSLAKLQHVKHFHMNNNSISGQIPPEFSKLQSLEHLLLDNNNLSGNLPSALSEMPSLLILQLDNNNFSGSSVPVSYGNMTKLVKLSLRNCSLQGSIPDMAGLPRLNFLDLSHNLLSGSIPSYTVSTHITTIDFSDNMLSGSIPSTFTDLPFLQILSLKNNKLNGSIPSSILGRSNFTLNGSLVLDFQNNQLTSISGALNLPPNVTLILQGNPICADPRFLNTVSDCGTYFNPKEVGSFHDLVCPAQSCPIAEAFEYIPASPISCFCAAPIRVGYRLKSPGFSVFNPYMRQFQMELASDLNFYDYQIHIDSFSWETGPRLRMHLKLFPNNLPQFSVSEIRRLEALFSEWKIHNRDIFGPYELLNFTLLGPYSGVDIDSSSGMSIRTVIGIVLGVFFAVTILSSIVSFVILKRYKQYDHLASKRHSSSSISVKVDGVKFFTFGQLSLATNNFSASSQIGEGGYGKVYKGILADETIVAIKRACQQSLQGSKEFVTEIELLSRLHHRNLVSLLGYCDEEDEQMLVYEFMPNGNVRDHLSGGLGNLTFLMRLQIALGSSRAVLYLHTEADPPIIHRDIKASNILLDSKFIAKVSDFGLSRLSPALDTEGTKLEYISTVVKGTPGYIDPEYCLTHKLTVKSDVYSLGVVFLELLTGERPISRGKNIVLEVRAAYKSNETFSMIDKRMGPYSLDCIEKFMSLALWCCNEDMALRPSMRDVVWELENIWSMALESDNFADFGSTSGRPPSSSGEISGCLASAPGSSCPTVSFTVIPR